MSSMLGPGRESFARPVSRTAPPSGVPEVHIGEEQQANAAETLRSSRSLRGIPATGMQLGSQGTRAASRKPSTYPRFMIGFIVAFFAYLLFLQTRKDVPNNGLLRGISDVFVLLGAGICAYACLSTAFKLRSQMHSSMPGIMARRAWIGWLFLGGSAAAYAIGQLIWTGYDAQSSTFPYPATYDYFYLTVYPLGWIGVALLIPRSGSAAGRTRLLLDAGIVVASAMAISWYFILGPTITGLTGSPLEKVVSLAYPLGDLSLCVASALLIFGPLGLSALAGSIWRLGIGVTILAVTDSLYGYFQLQGVYHTGFLQDVGWPMAWLFVGWGALIYPEALASLTGQRLSDEQSFRRARLSTAGAVIRAVLPISFALLTCVLLALEVALTSTAPLAQIVIVCAFVLVLPIIRQVLTLVDNLMLNERLRVALGQSQQAFQRSQQELVQTSTRAQQYDELRAGIEDLQAVHAKLARGDLGARARVEGPLSPVAQSLNLLTERLQRWAQFEQANRVLEEEANRLREVLDALSEGAFVPLPASRSTLPTGAALVSALRLQRQLALRFGRLREGLDMFGTRWKLAKDAVREAEQELKLGSTNQQVQLLTALEALLEVEQRLESNQAILQDFWMQIRAFDQGGKIEGL